MALSTTPLPTVSGEQAAVCSVGRWMTQDEWPGWQDECPQPGDAAPVPPYVLCEGHAADLVRRLSLN